MEEAINSQMKRVLGIGLGSFTLEKLASAVITFIICYIAIKIIMKLIKPIINKLPLDEHWKGFLYP